MSGKISDRRILRLRSLQAAVQEDWQAVEENSKAAFRMIGEPVAGGIRAAATTTYLLRMYTVLERIFQRITEEYHVRGPGSLRQLRRQEEAPLGECNRQHEPRPSHGERFLVDGGSC